MRLVRETQAPGVGELLRPRAAVQVDREVGREQVLVAVVWRQEGVSVRVSLVGYASDQKARQDIHMKRGTPCYLSPR
jgi:hypothetical protein